MCGHTLCETCIRELMPKKKTGYKYRFVCPLDNLHGDLVSANPTLFPKNIAIVNLVKKKNESVLSKNRISDIPHIECVDSTQSLSILENIQEHYKECEEAHNNIHPITLLND